MPEAASLALLKKQRTFPMKDAIGFVLLAVGALVIVPALYGGGMMSAGSVTKLGQWMAFAIVAIGLDLVWGYMGALSLCQFLFFTLGAYGMGLYLANSGPLDELGIPTCLSYVMSDVEDKKPPFFLAWFKPFPVAVLLGMLIPGLIALGIGVTTFRSRVKGVYFSILTQAIVVAFWLVLQKNDLKLGGTNGLTNFPEILGFKIAANPEAGPFMQTRFWLYVASVLVLMGVLGLAIWLVRSPLGRVLVAIRDDETRLRFSGYQAWTYKAFAFAVAGVFAAIGGMLYAPQKGIITPSDTDAFASILVVAWVALGGRGTLWGAVIGTLLVNLMYDRMTSYAPEYWMFVLGGLFIGVVLFLPGGLMSLPTEIRGWVARLAPASRSVSGQSGVKELAEV